MGVRTVMRMWVNAAFQNPFYARLFNLYGAAPLPTNLCPVSRSSAKLSEAAIAINDTCQGIGVDFGVFGVFAVAALGGPRESKVIDCAVHCQKEWLVEKLSQIRGFTSTGNTGADLASFLYGDENISIECFPTAMTGLGTIRIAVTGDRAGQKETKVLDPVLIYKGKL